jgi:hypothetical protein
MQQLQMRRFLLVEEPCWNNRKKECDINESINHIHDVNIQIEDKWTIKLLQIL